MSRPVRLPDYLANEIQRLADEEKRTLANMVRVLLEQALKIEGSERATTPLDRGAVTSDEYSREESAAKSSVVADTAVRSGNMKHPHEPFSLVCADREKHLPGIYCPTCKGDGSKR